MKPGASVGAAFDRDFILAVEPPSGLKGPATKIKVQLSRLIENGQI
jgi:hypothetical protein